MKFFPVRFLVFTVLCFVLPVSSWGRSFAAQPAESRTDTQSSERGKDLFSGRIAFRNGGPPCANCHSVAGLPFPNGGTLAPDLTREYAKLGPEGMDVALQTLFFPAMTGIYDAHSLTLEERNNLNVFFEQASTKPSPRGITPVIVLFPIGGFVILLGITSAVWRNRLRGVRKRLVESARPGDGVRP